MAASSVAAAIATRGRAWLTHPAAEVGAVIRARIRAQARENIEFALFAARPMQMQFPGLPVWDQYLLCRKARGAIIRDAAQRSVDRVIDEVSGAAALVSFLLAVVLTFWSLDPTEVNDPTLSVIPGMLGVAFPLMVLTLVPKARFLLPAATAIVTTAPPVLIVIVANNPSWVDAHLSWLVIAKHAGSPHQFVERILLGALLLVGYSAASSVATWVKNRARRHVRVNALGATPYDRLIHSWARAVRAVQVTERTWPSTVAMKHCDRQMLELWRRSHTELRSIYASFPLADEQAAAEDAARVAGSLHRHRMLLLTSGPGPTRDAVLESLRDGLACLIEGDRERLTRNLPPLSRKVRVIDRLKRFAPGAVLLSAGLVLPILSPIAQDAGLAGNLRITLLVMAVLSLVSAPENVSGKIEGLLDKAMPWKKG